MQSVIRIFTRLVLPLLALVIYTGCSSSPRRYNVVIQPAAAIGSVRVDIIGAAPSDLADWQSYPISKYWKTGDSRRRDADKVTLKGDSGKPFTLSAKDPIWKSWFARGVDHLVLIADLPGDFEDGPNDPRRKVLSLYPDDWKLSGMPLSSKELNIEIRESQIRVLTPAVVNH